jgi:L-asparaginase II
VGTPDGRGLALKILDGNGRAIDPAAVVCARDLLGLPADGEPLARLATPVIRNSRGAIVGGLEASLD